MICRMLLIYNIFLFSQILIKNQMSTPKKSVSVIIADGQFLIKESLKAILTDEGSFNIVAVHTGKNDIIKALNNNEVSILIIDPYFIDLNSVSEIKEFKEGFPKLNFLVLTNNISKAELHELNNLGITNILLKTADKEEIFEALNAVVKGKKYYSNELLEILFDPNEKKNSGEETGQLTTSEVDIVRLISEGLTTKEIAARKFISFHTVITHRKNIFRKLGVSSVSELLMYAIKSGWINMLEYNI
jgi:DNA-binding NarL/FixJ family response regulator